MRFFFYGTLMASCRNPDLWWLDGKVCEVGPAHVRGSLHAVPDPLGWYPALLPGDSLVRGVLFETAGDFTAADLAALDAYEDYDPVDCPGSLYRRAAVAVTPDGCGEGLAEAYLFNQPLPVGARPIAGGDFCAWLACEGASPFEARKSAP